MIPMLMLLLPVVRRCLWTKVFVACGSCFTVSLINVGIIQVIICSSVIQTVTTVHAESVYFRRINDESLVIDDPISNIVGGTPVGTSDSSLYASFAIPNNQRIFCGAILIWDDVLLSAAHCEGGYNDTSQTVMIGGTTLNGTDATETSVPIRKAIIHPDYKLATTDNQVENDIMLVFLQQPTNPIIPLAKFNNNPALPPDDTLVTVIGHGIDSRTTDELTYNLNALNMSTVNFFTCDNAYDVLNEDVHLCATGTRTAVAPCEGDSGGPLFYFDTVNSEYVIVGIVSFGICTFQQNTPSTVFTKVSFYPNWILSTICTNSIHPPTIEMCDGVVPLSRIPQFPTISPVNSTTPTPFATTEHDDCNERSLSSSYSRCTYLFFLQGTYVHRSILGTCMQKCTIFRNFFVRTGWDCGKCI